MRVINSCALSILRTTTTTYKLFLCVLWWPTSCSIHQSSGPVFPADQAIALTERCLRNYYVLDSRKEAWKVNPFFFQLTTLKASHIFPLFSRPHVRNEGRKFSAGIRLTSMRAWARIRVTFISVRRRWKAFPLERVPCEAAERRSENLTENGLRAVGPRSEGFHCHSGESVPLGFSLEALRLCSVAYRSAKDPAFHTLAPRTQSV